VALEWDDAEIKERLRSTFVNTNPIDDYTLPFLSLTKGAKVARLLAPFGSKSCGVPTSAFPRT
jgi:NTE family protein